jgi:hypothetical protein
MSRMQEASGQPEYDYAQLANSITSEHDDQEHPLRLADSNRYEGRPFNRARKDPVVWIVQHPTSRDKRNETETNRGLKSPIRHQTNASERQRNSQIRSRSDRHKVVCHLTSRQTEIDSLDTQIRIFKQREDLRECLLPGMISGISQKACEGWQRQATGRSSRFMAKIKLGPCKNCKYFSC